MLSILFTKIMLQQNKDTKGTTTKPFYILSSPLLLLDIALMLVHHHMADGFLLFSYKLEQTLHVDLLCIYVWELLTFLYTYVYCANTCSYVSSSSGPDFFSFSRVFSDIRSTYILFIMQLVVPLASHAITTEQRNKCLTLTVRLRSKLGQHQRIEGTQLAQ